MGKQANYQNFSNDQWDLIIGYDNNEKPITLREYVSRGKEQINLSPFRIQKETNKLSILESAEIFDLKKQLVLERINNIKEFSDFVHPEFGIVSKEKALNIIENDLEGAEELISLELENIEFILNNINIDE